MPDQPLTSRRTLPDSLRHLAEKLNDPIGDAERLGVALALNSLADEMDNSTAESLRKKLIYFTEVGITYEKDRDRRRAEAARLVDEYVHELAEYQRRVAAGWAADGYAAEADGLRQGADAIDPEAPDASADDTDPRSTP